MDPEEDWETQSMTDADLMEMEVALHEEREETPRKRKRTLEDQINEVGGDKKCLKFCQTRRAYEEHKKFMEGKSLIDNKRLKELYSSRLLLHEYILNDVI